jgi:hypothetical protein
VLAALDIPEGEPGSLFATQGWNNRALERQAASGSNSYRSLVLWHYPSRFVGAEEFPHNYVAAHNGASASANAVAWRRYDGIAIALLFNFNDQGVVANGFQDFANAHLTSLKPSDWPEHDLFPLLGIRV